MIKRIVQKIKTKKNREKHKKIQLTGHDDDDQKSRLRAFARTRAKK